MDSRAGEAVGLIDRIVALWRRQNPDEPLEDLTRTAQGLSRRRFLQVSTAASIGLATGGLHTLARPLVVVPDMGAVLQPINLTWLTKESLRHLKQTLSSTRFTRSDGMVIGQGGLTDHIAVDFIPPSSDPLMRVSEARKQFVEPIVSLIVGQMRQIGATTVGELDMPRHGCDVVSKFTDNATGLSLRGMRSFNIYEGRTVARMDILVGRASTSGAGRSMKWARYV